MMTAHFKGRCYRMSKKQKQAGAELCQAQDQLDLPAEAKLILEVVNPILVVLEKTFNLCQYTFLIFTYSAILSRRNVVKHVSYLTKIGHHFIFLFSSSDKISHFRYFSKTWKMT